MSKLKIFIGNYLNVLNKLDNVLALLRQVYGCSVYG